MAGEVRLGDHGERAAKPGMMVAQDVSVALDDKPRYVSRGGTKLENAIATTGIDPAGRHCLDVGASTGGFTDFLLQHGAAHVIALDVAYGELSWTVRNDDRVTVLERANARSLGPKELEYRPDLIVADVSFISLTKLLRAVLSTAADEYDALLMIKPQFEVGKGRVGSGGVVREPALRREALITVAQAALENGASVIGFASSGLPGPKGNQETFVQLAEPGREGALDSKGIAAAAERIEP
jgi:23S rRNA (cytidine1920-2'-O)/16S rRNA (cytidine1409-2'-O)-methyltransferase